MIALDEPVREFHGNILRFTLESKTLIQYTSYCYIRFYYLMFIKKKDEKGILDYLYNRFMGETRLVIRDLQTFNGQSCSQHAYSLLL